MIREEDLDVENFNPDVAISEWYNAKVPTVHRVLTTTQIREKRLAEKSFVVELAAMTLSDLEDLDSNEEQ